jgi:hypothetical protein
MKKAKFKVGDIVIGNDHATRLYSITKAGFKGKVVKAYPTDESGSDKDIVIEKLTGGSEFAVSSFAFDLVLEDRSKEHTYEVSEEMIKLGHRASCSEWKEKLEKKFPEVFLAEEFHFGESHLISTTKHDNAPLFVGYGLAPDELELKCLMLNEDFDMYIDGVKVESSTNPIITFVKKQKK